MVVKVQEAHLTIDEYQWVSKHLESIGFPVELEEGRLIKRVSTKAWHSSIVASIMSYIQMHLITHDLSGIVTGETTGYQAADDDCPEPDVAYCAALDIAPDTPCIPVAPALVVEVVSDPNNRRELERLENKRPKYLDMGAAACGALDMAGNLWEWCANNYENPATINAGNGESKALPGGPFNPDQNFAACAAYRHNFSPDYNNSSYGVRLVLAFPIHSDL